MSPKTCGRPLSALGGDPQRAQARYSARGDILLVALFVIVFVALYLRFPPL